MPAAVLTRNSASSDETERIQNAIDENGLVLLQPGNWPYTTLSYPDKAVLSGAGAGQTDLQQISGTAQPLLKPAGYGYTRVKISDIKFSAYGNSANTGGLLLEGTARAILRDYNVEGCKTYGVKVLGHGNAESGDAMYFESHNGVINNLKSGAKCFHIAPASGGGSHPDGARIFGGYLGIEEDGGTGTGIYVEGPSVDEAGALGADNLLVMGVNVQHILTPFDIVAQSAIFVGCRFEHTSAGMDAYIRAGTTNFPSRDNHFFGNTYPASEGFTLHDAGQKTALIHDATDVMLLAMFAGEYTYRLRTSGDEADRFRIRADGRIEFGDGSNTPDASIYRVTGSNPVVLRLEDAVFNVLKSELADPVMGANKSGAYQTWKDLLSGQRSYGDGVSDGVFDYVFGPHPTTRDFMFTGLPTADPHVAGALWTNSGVVTVSAG